MEKFEKCFKKIDNVLKFYFKSSPLSTLIFELFFLKQFSHLYFKSFQKPTTALHSKIDFKL